ncbi:hypothetical protein GOP47_0000328 [Adiantum capillus-veneris]|uniref:LOB domain-containing protein n=1 Tax=Adiantum capillus-veneris TaxID=13818 RepID=A0A9D4ZQG1_ADICA|nr:hypothetical protein GOP47_0000328 [Adiantum capillus-veneris]
MSCNGCRVLRKGCSDTCILRSCLQWIESPEAQGHATVFVAKFFGRAGMLSFINSVAESQRPALFQSLLYEACGRTVNPVFGAVGLLWSGNWAACQAAVETVLKGGSLKPTACPLSTMPPHKSPGNPSLKRPHSMTEANMSSSVEAKRFRSSDWHDERPELRSNVDVAPMDHSMPAFLPDFEVNTSSNPVFLGNCEASRQEQSPALPCGQLIAPVARRVNPQGGHALATMVVRRHQQASCQEEQERQSREIVELGLSLNSNAQEKVGARKMERCDDGKVGGNTYHDVESHVHHIEFVRSLCSEGEHASLVEAVRASSPCSLSMNSEGSVTSVDTAELSISGVRAFATNMARQEDCQLLHLL